MKSLYLYLELLGELAAVVVLLGLPGVVLGADELLADVLVLGADPLVADVLDLGADVLVLLVEVLE